MSSDLLDIRRHAPVAKYRAPRLRQQHAYGLANVSKGRARHIARDIFEPDEGVQRRGRPFRWLLSTLLAAVVGVAISGIVIYGSLRRTDSGADIMQQLEEASRPLVEARRRSEQGLPWLTPKESRLQVATSALTIRQIIHEQIRVRKDGKPFLQVKPYLRLSVRLAPASPDYADRIPSFNPLELFENTVAAAAVAGAGNPGYGTVTSTVVELLDGRLPASDGQSFADFEIAALVKTAIETEPDAVSVRFGGDDETGSADGDLADGALINAMPAGLEPQGVTVLRRSPSAFDGTPVSLEKREVRVVTAKADDTMQSILEDNGAPSWQAREIAFAADQILKGEPLNAGDQLYITTVPSLDRNAKVDVMKLSLFAEGQIHRVSIRRTATGQFSASTEPDQSALIQAMSNDNEKKLSTLFAAVYATGLAQNLTEEHIMSIVRVHAHDVDFQRPVQPGDQLELFFTLSSEGEAQVPGELVYTALSTGGQTRRFWRFRSQDGTIDFFDRSGQNARRFLLRKPVRGENVRLTSGFGMRRHPLLNRLRPHNGIDWAARPGTPILAAGKGTIAFAGRRGAYGNFVRIEHANGYETAYAHMQRFAPSTQVGRQVRQGEVIGYVGTTGLSSGPHLHFEVRVNQRHVDPLKIRVGRERNLNGRELGEFQRERERIMSVLRSPPIRTAQR